MVLNGMITHIRCSLGQFIAHLTPEMDRNEVLQFKENQVSLCMTTLKSNHVGQKHSRCTGCSEKCCSEMAWQLSVAFFCHMMTSSNHVYGMVFQLACKGQVIVALMHVELCQFNVHYNYCVLLLSICDLLPVLHLYVQLSQCQNLHFNYSILLHLWVVHPYMYLSLLHLLITFCPTTSKVLVGVQCLCPWSDLSDVFLKEELCFIRSFTLVFGMWCTVFLEIFMLLIFARLIFVVIQYSWF